MCTAAWIRSAAVLLQKRQVDAGRGSKSTAIYLALPGGGVEGKWIQPPSASGFPQLAKLDPLNPRNQLCGLPPSGQHPANACVRLPRLGTRVETHCQKSLHLEPRFSLVRRVPCLRCPRYQARTITEDCRVPASGCRSWRILGPGKGPASRVGED